MEIGLFQLENLFLSRTQFCFLDLRPMREPLEPSLDALLAKATPVAPEKVEEYLRAAGIAKSFPVVLVCDHGEVSTKLTRKLEAAGHDNIYIVARGAGGLASEL
jgi:rhodanese-related sulfurtransferase